MRRIVIAGLAALLVIALGAAASAPRALPAYTLRGVVLNLHLVAKVEHAIKLPAGAKPLSSYQRHYTLEQVQDRILVHAVLTNLGSGVARAGARILRPEDMPVIMDGGCSVVEALFDPKTGHQLWIGCHGLA